MVNCPEYSRLEKPFKLDGLPGQVKKSFYELAKKRVRLVSQDEHFQFEKDVWGDNWKQSSALYMTSTKKYKDKGTFLNGLDISVNKDFFLDGNINHSDLIPYVIEHEILEAWLNVKPGYRTNDLQKNHFLARIRQFRRAMMDGKAEKLLNFYRKINSSIEYELNYAYQKAMQRVRKNQDRFLSKLAT